MINIVNFTPYFLQKGTPLEQFTTIMSVVLITILSLLTLALYKNNNIRLKTNNMLFKKNKELLSEKENAEIEAEEARKQLKKYTSIKIDKHLRTAISQYLSFFSSYVEQSKKVLITLNTRESEDGLDISFNIPENIDDLILQDWFEDYLNHLTSNEDMIEINTVESVTVEELDILILKLKQQINHYKRQIDILNIENSYLKDNTEYFKDVIKLLSSKSPQLFISATNSKINEQNNFSNQSQFIGSTFNQGNFSISNIDEKIIDLIKESSISEIERKELINSVSIIKDESKSEREKKKSGGLIKKFLETTVSESAKELMKFIIENSDTWLKYISNI